MALRPGHFNMTWHSFQVKLQMINVFCSFPRHHPAAMEPFGLHFQVTGHRGNLILREALDARCLGLEVRAAGPGVVAEALVSVAASASSTLGPPGLGQLGVHWGVDQYVVALTQGHDAHAGAWLGRTRARGLRWADAGAQTGATQRTQVPAHDLAEVGAQQHVDEGVVDGGGLGEHGRHGEGQRRDALEAAERSPHGHHRIGAPGSEEANTHGHTELETTKGEQEKCLGEIVVLR